MLEALNKQKGMKGQAGTCRSGRQLDLSLPASPHLQPSVEVPVQLLHNEQHGNAGATTVAVVDDRTMEVHQSLMLRQRPGGKERGLGYNAQYPAGGNE